MYKKIFFSCILFLFVQIISFSQTKPLKKQEHVVNKALKAFLADKDLKNASISFLAVDAKTGEVVTEHNPDLSMMPASTLKLVTTATALEVLGSRYTFKTKLEYSGVIDTVNGVLNGNIYIKGGADPTLGSVHYDNQKKYGFINTWINTLLGQKIKTIKGRIIADASRYSTEIAPPKWAWEDIGNYYGAGANGLTAFDNLYEVYFQSPALPDKLTKIIKREPEIPGLVVYNEVLSSNNNRDEAFIFGAPYRYLQIIRGTIPKGRSEFKIKGAIPDPAYYMAWFVSKKLEENNVKTEKEATTIRLMRQQGDTINEKTHHLHTLYSPPLYSIINITNKKSINLFAEHLLNEIGYKLGKEGSNSAGRKAIMSFWKNKGMDIDGLHIHDGCGLSRSNSITAKQLVFLLRYMKKSKNFSTFYKSLPVAGKSGTLRHIGRNTSAQGAVHAKSGSIGLVRAYTGYVTTKGGRELAFSMNIANYNCSSYSARKKLTDLMIAMADFNL
jgi:serine-type D-Ala-D-Ala carboxypeptidase/endopeptidase (penicillin-binding protein 4)